MLYFTLNIFSILLAYIPRKIALYFGKNCGLMLYYLNPIRKKVAFINLKIVFPDKTSKEINSIIKKSYMHYGLMIMDFIRNATAKVRERNYNISGR